MKVHPSALKHGVSAQDAIQAAEWSLWIEPLDDDGPPERELRLGFDTNARLMETVVLVYASGDEMVIHAMPARKKYLDLLPSPHPWESGANAVLAAVGVRLESRFSTGTSRCGVRTRPASVPVSCSRGARRPLTSDRSRSDRSDKRSTPRVLLRVSSLDPGPPLGLLPTRRRPCPTSTPAPHCVARWSPPLERCRTGTLPGLDNRSFKRWCRDLTAGRFPSGGLAPVGCRRGLLDRGGDPLGPGRPNR